jgi:hypothetical protein
MPLLWAAIFVLVLALSWLRTWDQRSWPTWRELGESNARRVEALATGTRHQVEMTRGFLALAERELTAAARDRAEHWLDAARTAVGSLTRDLQRDLADWGRRARALAALRPAPLPRFRSVRGLPLRGLVAGWHVADAVVVTSRDRFVLRTWVLRKGLGLLWSRCRRLALPPRLVGAWMEAHNVASNLDTLSAQAITTYTALEASLLQDPAAAVPLPRDAAARGNDGKHA